jgi:hypothetical protein
MQDNYERIKMSEAELKLLLDNNVYVMFEKIYLATGVNMFELLDQMDNVEYYFSHGVINEQFRGPAASSGTIVNLFNHYLNDEMASDGRKMDTFLYNDKNGKVRYIKLSNISAADYNQILLCQNHKELVLVTNDHKMLKSAAPLLDRRMMHIEYMLDYLDNATPPGALKDAWHQGSEYFKANLKLSLPTTVWAPITDRQEQDIFGNNI